MLDLVARSHQIEVDGLDVRDWTIAYGLGDEKFSQSGLIKKTGSLQLQYNADFPEHFDVRENPRWSRGKPVVLKAIDKRRVTLKQLAFAYIRSSQWERPWTLNIQLTDILGLLDYRSPPDDKSGVCLGRDTAVNAVIQRLIRAAATGVPVENLQIATNVPGVIRVPTPKRLSGSYIAQAGELAFSRGYLLYVDARGTIRSRKIPLGSKPTSFKAVVTEGVDDAGSGLVLADSGDIPPEKIVLRGTKITLTENEEEVVREIEEYGPASIAGVDSTRQIVVRQTTITERMDWKQKRKITETLVREPKGAFLAWMYPEGSTQVIESRREEQIDQYETNVRIPLDFATPSIDGDGDCDEGNMGRLKFSSKKVWRRKGDVLSEFITQHKLDSNENITYPGFTGTVTVIIGEFRWLLAEVEETTYKYLDETDEREEITTWIETRKQLIRAAIAPKIYKYSKDATNHRADDLTDTEVTRTEWTENRPDEWERQERSFQAVAVGNPGLVDNEYRKAVRGEKSILAVRQFARSLGISKFERAVSNSGQTQPPAPTQYPAQFSEESEEVKIEFPVQPGLGYQFAERVREFSIPHLPETIVRAGSSGSGSVRVKAGGRGNVSGGLGYASAFGTAARDVANILAGMLWGRFRALRLETSHRDWMFGYKPLDPVKVIEFDPLDREYKAHAYWIDGFSIAATREEFKIGTDLLWAGKATVERPRSLGLVAIGEIELSVTEVTDDISEGTVVFLGAPSTISLEAVVASGSTQLQVAAIPAALPAGSVIRLGDAIAITSVATAAGATQIQVEPIEVDIAPSSGLAGAGAIASVDVPPGSESIPFSFVTPNAPAIEEIVWIAPDLEPPYQERIVSNLRTVWRGANRVTSVEDDSGRIEVSDARLIWRSTQGAQEVSVASIEWRSIERFTITSTATSVWLAETFLSESRATSIWRADAIITETSDITSIWRSANPERLEDTSVAKSNWRASEEIEAVEVSRSVMIWRADSPIVSVVEVSRSAMVWRAQTVEAIDNDDLLLYLL